jgi:phosphoglycolate phosphatase
LRLVVFDMDGTLIDSVGLIVETVTAAFEAAGEAVPDERTIRSISGLTLNIALQKLAPAADAEGLVRLSERYRAEYRARANGREPLFPGALEALDELRNDPDTALAVATGKGLSGARRLLAGHGIEHYFSSVQTPDDNPSKPAPQMIFNAMAAAGATARETVMIGDTNHDMEMAQAAGVAAIGVAWGYHPPVELFAAGADLVLDRFDQLGAALTTLLE